MSIENSKIEQWEFEDEMFAHLNATGGKGCGEAQCLYCNSYWEQMRDK